MRNVLKLGFISLATAVALAQTPATTQSWEEDDVLAIASRGALSDKMQGFRKLADDEAGSIFGGGLYFFNHSCSTYNRYETGYLDRYDYLSYYTKYYPMQLTTSERSGRRLNIGAGDSYSDYNEFVRLAGSAYGQVYIRLEVDFRINRTRQSIVDRNGNAVGNTAFTNRLVNFARSYYLDQFSIDRSRYADYLRSLRYSYGFK